MKRLMITLVLVCPLGSCYGHKIPKQPTVASWKGAGKPYQKIAGTLEKRMDRYGTQKLIVLPYSSTVPALAPNRLTYGDRVTLILVANPTLKYNVSVKQQVYNVDFSKAGVITKYLASGGGKASTQADTGVSNGKYNSALQAAKNWVAEFSPLTDLLKKELVPQKIYNFATKHIDPLNDIQSNLKTQYNNALNPADQVKAAMDYQTTLASIEVNSNLIEEIKDGSFFISNPIGQPVYTAEGHDFQVFASVGDDTSNDDTSTGSQPQNGKVTGGGASGNIPQGLKAVAQSEDVKLLWTPVIGTSVTYSIYRRTASEKETSIKTDEQSSSYDDPKLQNGTTYFYTVTSTSNGIESVHSQEVSATPTATTSNPQSQTPSQPAQSNASSAAEIQPGALVIPVYGNPRPTFSLGIFFTSLASPNYFASGGKIAQSRDEFSPVPGAMINGPLEGITGARFLRNFYLGVGVGVRDSNPTYLVGLSYMVGTAQRFGITIGLAGAQVNRLNGANIGDTVPAAGLPNTSSVFRTGGFFGFSYNF